MRYFLKWFLITYVFHYISWIFPKYIIKISTHSFSSAASCGNVLLQYGHTSLACIHFVKQSIWKICPHGVFITLTVVVLIISSIYVFVVVVTFITSVDYLSWILWIELPSTTSVISMAESGDWFNAVVQIGHYYFSF